MSPDEFGSVLKVIVTVFAAVWFFLLFFLVLYMVASWKIFKKAGRPGWTSLIPVYNTYAWICVVYDGFLMKKIMIGVMLAGMLSGFASPVLAMVFAKGDGDPPFIIGVLMVVLGLVAVVLGFKFQIDLARSYGMGPLFGVGLIFLPFIFYLILGFSRSITYCGPCGRNGYTGGSGVTYDGVGYNDGAPMDREAALEELRRRRAARAAGQAQQGQGTQTSGMSGFDQTNPFDGSKKRGPGPSGIGGFDMK